MEPSLTKFIVICAIACNNHARGKDPPEPALVQQVGEKRLIDLAARFGRLLELYAQLKKWEQFLDYASALAIAIRDGVFLGRGPETAQNLILCLLAEAGFRLHEGQTTGEILEAIELGDTRQLAAHLKGCYAAPG